jgi:hypothetical protein
MNPQGARYTGACICARGEGDKLTTVRDPHVTGRALRGW